MQDFQKTYTTRQQCEELLKAGIPKWSADMKYESDDNSPTMVERSLWSVHFDRE
jgi:hypothetical protein